MSLLRRVAAREMLTGHRAVMAWASLVLASLTAAVSALPMLHPAVRFAVLLPFVCLAPGAAVVCLVRLGDFVSSWAMAFVLSLAVAGVVADVMLWTNQWHPEAAYILMAALTAVANLVRLGPHWLPRPPDPEPPPPRLAFTAAPHPPPGALDATTTLPQVAPSHIGRPPAGGFTDATTYLQRVRQTPRFDETMLLPLAPMSDRTTILPAMAPRSADETALIRLPEKDETALIRLPERRDPPPDEVLMGVVASPEAKALLAQERPRAIRPVLVEITIAAGILGVWLFSLSRTSTANVGDYGLLSVVHPTFFVAVGLCAIRFVVELAQARWRGWVLVVQTVVLILIMHATVPLLVYEPEYAWSYKHVGVVELLRANGHITNSYDLYQQWPTFFAVVAHITDVSGVDPLRLAAWAPVFFDLAFAIPLFAIARTLSTDRRVPYLTVFLFSAVNWVAQDYLAPQPYAYILCLGTLLILLRWLRRTANRHGKRTDGFRHRLWSWASSGLAEVPYTSKYARRTALVALYLVYAVVVASHQLSPYLIAMCAAALLVLGLVRPLQIVPIFIGIAILYLVPRYAVADNYGLFNGLNFFSNAQSASPVLGTTEGRVFSADLLQFLSLSVWGLAALTVVASLKRPGPIALPAVLAFTPFGLLLAQSYGGEAIYRVYLFSIPWCAYLVATVVLRRAWVPAAIGVPAAALLLAAAPLASMQGAHGQLSFNQFSRAEVEASQYILTHAPPGSQIIMAAANFPTRVTANYDEFNDGPNSDKSLIHPDEGWAVLLYNEDDMVSIAAQFGRKDTVFVVVSPAMVTFLHYFGYVPDGTLQRLHNGFRISSKWKLYYQNQDVYIYQLVR